MTRRSLLWIAGLALVGCIEVADPASSLVAFLVTPVFDSNGAFAADADRLKLTLEREDTPGSFTQVAQLFVNIDPATGEADTTLTVALFQSPTRFRLILEAIRSTDGAVLYQGVDTVLASAGTTGVPAEVPVTYVGPTAADLVLAPRDTAVEAGTTFTFRASTFGSTGGPVDVPVRFYLVRPADSLLLRVDRRSGQATTAAGAQGETEVYATTPGGLAADTARVLIGAIPAGVALDPGYANVAIGSSLQFSGSVVDALGNPLSVFPVQWTSRNTSVATVDATGRVTGAAPGLAIVVLQAADVPGSAFSDSALVTVPSAGNVVVSTTADQRGFVRAAVGETVVIDVTADMTFADELLGSYNAVLTWDPAVLAFLDVQAGDFPAPELNSLNAEIGELRFAQANANGSAGVVVLARVRFAAAVSGSTPMSLAITEMSAAQTFTNLINQVTVTNGTVTVQ